MTGQFHFDPATYLETMRAEVSDFDALQSHVARATADRDVASILDLGTGTGVTAVAVLELHPGARLTGLDESAAMLEHARATLPGAVLLVHRLEDPLPEGPFDLVISALAVHHLEGPGKADLFRRIAAVLRPGGRFVLGDVVVPERPDDAVSPLDDRYDRPSRLTDQLAWLVAAGFGTSVVWSSRDLVVVAADRPAAS